MNNRAYLITSGSLFALITLGQLTRMTLQIPVQVGTWSVPLWPSLVVVIVALALFIWAIRLIRAG